jgi:ribosomal protein S12 methylthiotransferase
MPVKEIITEISQPTVPAPTRPTASLPTKVGFVSLGCPKNLVDSEVMMGMLAQGGALLTPDAAEADVIVVNTCSFIGTAQQESIDTILEMARHKTNGKAKRLVVAGCLVERFHDEIRKNIPEVDAVVGTGELEKILSAAGVAQAPSTPSPFNILTSRPEGDHRRTQGRFARDSWDGAVADLPNYLYDDHTPRVLTTPGYSAYIKIAEGCDHPCTFCIIPQLRGQFRSRRFESVIAEAERLAHSGVREITLIGQDTTCYGEDLGLKDGLALLLEKLAAIENLRWIRFLYAYPNKVTQKLLDTIAAHPALVKYIDMPLQHASAPVLKRMKRGASGEIFLRLIERIRRTIPGAAIRTSMIVGFPGETAEDFETLRQFVEAAQFDRLGVFSYSDEDSSSSFHLDGKVDARTIYNRKRSLMATQRKVSKARNRRLVGQEVSILVEGRSKETDLLWEGRMPTQAAEIDGVTLINDYEGAEPRSGEIRRLRITEAHDYDVVGTLLPAMEARPNGLINISA